MDKSREPSKGLFVNNMQWDILVLHFLFLPNPSKDSLGVEREGFRELPPFNRFADRHGTVCSAPLSSKN